MDKFLYDIFYSNIDKEIFNFVKNNYYSNLKEALYWYIFFNLEKKYTKNLIPDWENTYIKIIDINLTIKITNTDITLITEDNFKINFIEIPNIFEDNLNKQ
ncbi:MAG: hypothetical protein MJH09_13245 [Cetobacterium sp.]|nr:hypothetical protein [Cetobacterium sp.]